MAIFRTAEGEFVIGTELAAWLLPDARARLAPAREAGWLSLEQSDSGTLLRSRLKLDNGQLWLNGHAVP